MSADATQLTLTVSTARDCTWKAQSTASWLQVSPADGQGEAAVSVSVSANPDPSGRTAAISVNSAEYQVFQDGRASTQPPLHCSYMLTPVSRFVGENGGTRDVRILTGTDCPWTAASSVSWITITGPKSGTGSTILEYRVDRNRSDDPRIGTIVIAGQIHVVQQAGD